jgi:hypothetical protein
MAKSEKVDEQGEITLPLCGEVFNLRPSHAAIKAIQRETGKSLYELASRAQGLALTLDEVEIVATEMIRAWGDQNPSGENATSHRGASRPKIGEMIFEEGDAKVQRVLGVLLVAALTGGVTKSGEVKAPEQTTNTPSAK